MGRRGSHYAMPCHACRWQGSHDRHCHFGSVATVTPHLRLSNRLCCHSCGGGGGGDDDDDDDDDDNDQSSHSEASRSNSPFRETKPLQAARLGATLPKNHVVFPRLAITKGVRQMPE